MSSLSSAFNSFNLSPCYLNSTYSSFYVSFTISYSFYYYLFISSISILTSSIYSLISAFLASYLANFMRSSFSILANYCSFIATSSYKLFIISRFLVISSVACYINLSCSPIEFVSTSLSLYKLVTYLCKLSKSTLWRAALSYNSYFYLFYIYSIISYLDLFIIDYW